MHLVEQRRQSLYFVDDHPVAAPLPAQLVGEQARIAQVGLVDALVEEIEPRRLGEARLRPGALADPAQAEQEEALARGGQQARIRSLGNHVVIFPGKLTAWQQGVVWERVHPHVA